MERAVYLGELAALSRVEYEHQRNSAAKKLGVRVGVLDKLVEELQDKVVEQEKQQQLPQFLQPIEPWPEPVAGVELMKELVGVFDSYCVTQSTPMSLQHSG
jgi:hypothetical protein